MILRDYQQAAVDCLYNHLDQRDDHPLIVMPTGSGKSPVIAAIARDCVESDRRILILAHVKELLTQTADKIKRMDPSLPLGMYSAGLGKRQTQASIIVAGIQSVYRRAAELGPFDLIALDECHMLPKAGDGMYRRLIADALAINPDVRICGLTATPFRLDSGLLWGDGCLFGSICYEIGVVELIKAGWLSPLKSREGAQRADLSEVHIRGGEFVPDEMAEAFDKADLIDSACREMIELTRERKSVLVFCSSIAHALSVKAKLVELKQDALFVCGETANWERDAIFDEFRGMRAKWLINVNVATTGFDAPGIDCIVLLRATLSPGLYIQMIGRGSRLADGKRDCAVLDYGGNVRRHGPINKIKMPKPSEKDTKEDAAKLCEMCQALIPPDAIVCPECGVGMTVEEPEKETKEQHGAKADDAPIIDETEWKPKKVTVTEFDVRGVRYGLHRKKNKPDATPTLRVDYNVGWEHWISEWICFEHEGFARQKAEKWWKARSELNVPETIEEAVAVCRVGGVAMPTRITVREVEDDPFPRIEKYAITEPFDPGEAWESPEFERTKTHVFDPFGLVCDDEVPGLDLDQLHDIPF